MESGDECRLFNKQIHRTSPVLWLMKARSATEKFMCKLSGAIRRITCVWVQLASVASEAADLGQILYLSMMDNRTPRR
jgi:hypothetical protein